MTYTDDVLIKILDPGAEVVREAKFWSYLGDWLNPYAVYHFTIERKRNGALSFLEGYQGYLQGGHAHNQSAAIAMP